MVRAPVLFAAVVLNEVRGLFVAGPIIGRVVHGQSVGLFGLSVDVAVGLLFAAAIMAIKKQTR